MTIINCTKKNKMDNNQILKNEMRLIGYYNNPNQTMHAETEYIEEATLLAERLKTSFNSIRNNTATDDIFRSILNSNAVFILKDEEQNLYAYFPCKDIARVSNVVYNKKSVVPIPLKYKSWFIPGETIVIEDKKTEYSQRYTITTSGSDFLITDRKRHKTLALNWSQDTYISIKDLSEFINDNWVLLYEYNTKESCGDCDGYDYSNCDMSRCKNDCDTCGGRRHKCNNSCFYHRHKKALSYELNENIIKDDLAELFDILSIVIKPKTEHNLLFEQYHSLLEDAYNHCRCLSNYIDITNSTAEDFIFKMDYCIKLNEGRRTVKEPKDLITININGYKVACVKRKDIEYRTKGFLFWKTHHIIAKGIYDCIKDTIVDFDYKLEFSTKESRRDFVDKYPRISTLHLKREAESLLVQQFNSL